MDDLIFKETVAQCKSVTENTTCLEIFSYSDQRLNTVTEEPIDPETRLFSSFLERKDGFSPSHLPKEVTVLGGLRMIVQENANHPQGFLPSMITMGFDAYISMFDKFRLPKKAIESSAATGLLFWFDMYHEKNNCFLQMLYRKSFSNNNGTTNCFEIILSHDFASRITSGFCRAQSNSVQKPTLSLSLTMLKKCVTEISHPLMFPLIHSAHDLDDAETKQRKTEIWLREHAETTLMQRQTSRRKTFTEDEHADLDAINRDLASCQRRILWIVSLARRGLSESFQEASELFFQTFCESSTDAKKTRMLMLHRSVMSRLGFHKRRWAGAVAGAENTMHRLEIQRTVLHSLMTQNDSRLNLRMAREQKKLAQTAKRDSDAVRGLTLLGLIFIPGSYIASIFSTSFFDFKDAATWDAVVSPRFWIFWAVNVPVTLLILGTWYLWVMRRDGRYEEFGEEGKREE